MSNPKTRLPLNTQALDTNMFSNQRIILAVVFMCVSVASELEVTPFMRAARPGDDVEFVCGEADNDTKPFYVRWSVEDSSQQNISMTIPEFGRVQAVNGTLTISNVSYNDSGTYMCDDDAGSDTQTGVLKVYDMPEYWKEGLIIGSICLALLLLLLVCSYLSTVRQRQQKKWRLLQVEKRDKKQLSLNIND